MKASEFVTTETERRESALDLARTETADAVNTGIVGAADKSASLLKEDAPLAKPAGGRGGSAASRAARRAVSSALEGSGLEGADSVVYTAYYGASAAKAVAAKARASRKEASAQADGDAAGDAAPQATGDDAAATAAQGVGLSDRLKGGVRRGAMSAVRSALRGSEIEGADDVVYTGVASARMGRRGVEAARGALEKQRAKQAALAQTKMQATRHQMQAISDAQSARAAKAGTSAASTGASRSAASAASVGSSGGGGAAAAAGGGAGCLPIMLLFALILLIAIAGGAGGSEDRSAGALSDNEKIVAEYLKDKGGLENVQIAAIIANMYQESGVNPESENASSGAFGLCQWLHGRKDGLFALCDGRGVPHTDINAQLDFFWEEFTMQRGGGWSSRSNYDDFMACTSDDQLELAIEIFARNFERCSEAELVLDKRNEQGRRILSALTTGGGAVASVGDLQWPSDTPQWGTYAGHYGLDIKAPDGSPIFAPADGTVIWAGSSWESTYGNIVRIHHDGLGLQTACAHMSSVAVSKGDRVTKGQLIGYVGSTGNSTGPHIHFEIYEIDSPVIGGYPIMDNMDKWAQYFDRASLDANRVSY